MTQVHPNSRKIKIFRKESFIMNTQAGSAPEFLSQAKKGIGAYWKSTTSKAVGTGLNFAEQQLLLPEVVDCEPTDRNFRAAVTKYYNNIKTTVPYPDGIELEIGLTVDNNAPLSVENQPLDLYQYLQYRHALEHPEVALDKDAAMGSQIKQYYIYDPQAVEDIRLKLSGDTDRALQKYLDLKEQPEKHDWVLTLFLVDPRKFNGKKNAAELKVEEIKSLMTKDPTQFISILDDKFFEDKYWLRTLINLNIFKMMGKMVVDTNTSETIGNNMDEAISWWRNPVNSESVVVYKAQAKELLAPKSLSEKAN